MKKETLRNYLDRKWKENFYNFTQLRAEMEIDALDKYQEIELCVSEEKLKLLSEIIKLCSERKRY